VAWAPLLWLPPGRDGLAIEQGAQHPDPAEIIGQHGPWIF